MATQTSITAGNADVAQGQLEQNGITDDSGDSYEEETSHAEADDEAEGSDDMLGHSESFDTGGVAAVVKTAHQSISAAVDRTSDSENESCDGFKLQRNRKVRPLKDRYACRYGTVQRVHKLEISEIDSIQQTHSASHTSQSASPKKENRAHCSFVSTQTMQKSGAFSAFVSRLHQTTMVYNIKKHVNLWQE